MKVDLKSNSIMAGWTKSKEEEEVLIFVITSWGYSAVQSLKESRTNSENLSLKNKKD